MMEHLNHILEHVGTRETSIYYKCNKCDIHLNFPNKAVSRQGLDMTVYEIEKISHKRLWTEDEHVLSCEEYQIKKLLE